MPTSSALEAELARFGHSSFRNGQREAIETLLDRKRLLLVAPTGGGKSLTYQLPAVLLPGTTLVISPLIALMQDQVEALEACDIEATFLASTLDGSETRTRMRGLAQGDYKLAYVAPERLAQPGFQSLLRDLECSLLAVDEAHCISEWGHDFRPEYMQIGELAAGLRAPRILACTATATPVVRDEIIERLGLPSDTPQLVRGFARPNLSLRALFVQGDRDRRASVDEALAEALGEPRGDRGTAIIYAPTRRSSEKEAERLRKRGWRATHYHAGLESELRSSVLRDFMQGGLDVVVATNAFGMGIDRADVRAVVHLGPPGSVEAYYQEVGRAGRDGEPALGLLLHASTDLPLRRHLIESSAENEPVSAEIVDHRWNLFLELMRYADGGSCRHDTILRYFGDEEEALAGCGLCDVCRGLADGSSADLDEETVSLIVRKALSGVARIEGRFGLGAALQLLRGVADERLARCGLDETRTFGTLSEYREEWLQRVLRRLITAGWVDFSGGQRPVAVLSPEGRAVMKGERPVRLALPSLDEPSRRGAGSGRSRGAAAPPDDELAAEDQPLMDALRAHRLAVSRSLGVPPYVVAHDRTLRDIARLKPATQGDLLLAHGMGPAKLKRFGDGLLQAVREATGA